MAYNALEYRPNVRPTEQVFGLIAPGHCWHFDAWLFSTGHEHMLALIVETRKGGRDLLTHNEYVWDGRSLRYANTAPDSGPLGEVTLQDRALVSRADELNELHRRVLAMAARVPAGFRSRSVALHYVRAPSLAPFDADVVNLHQYGGN